MKHPASEIRCDNDLKLYQALLANLEVRRVRETLEKQEENRKGPGVRRHLLSTSVRLSRSMSGALHTMADRCQERLGIESRLELYAYPAPQFNAACFKPEDGRVYIMFSSSLLEAFSEQELLFVMGHELGHHVYRHHEIPIGYILRGKTRPAAALALDLFAWSRYAEVSADRAGAYCAEDLPSVARALFKLASGLRDDAIVQFDLEEFLRQVDDMLALGEQPGQGAPMQDWFLTHPFSPLRVKALTIFDRSALMRSGGIGKHDLEDQVQTVMGLMEPDYLKGKTEATRAMRNLFVAGAIGVADAAGGISDKERQTLEEFFEEGYALEKLDPERLRELLPKRIEAARKKASLSQRMHVVRDLCLIAGVEQPVVQAESRLLEEIAQELEIPTDFVSQCLEASPELD
jgi:Zn-dependent protease with chaperone function